MQDRGSITATEMIARREATEQEVAALIGQLVFAYSRLVTGLHLCVAWHNGGRDIEAYAAQADDLVAAALIRRVEAQAETSFEQTSRALEKYKDWARRAHSMRELRNIVMHSRWSIEAYGRHATALHTPVFVEPAKERTFTADQLRDACRKCDDLTGELSSLREAYPL